MSEERRGAASAIGFRRDVTWFLSALVGFFVILILILIALMQVLLGQVERTTQSYWIRSADAAARATNAIPSGSPAALGAGLAGIRGAAGVAAIEIARPGGAPIRVGAVDPEAAEAITRPTRHGQATYYFDRSEIDELRRRLFWLTAISFASVIAGTLLLLLYVRRIARPIERLLDEASAIEARPQGVEETDYIIDAFRKTIASLREKEVELQDLHDRQKARADDLALVSETLTRSLGSGFLALDAAGTIIQMNDAGRRILDLAATPVGVPPQTALGNTAFARTVADACAGREALSRVEVPVETSGGTRIVGLSTAPLADAEGRFLGLLALFADLTPVRELETRVREMRALADLGELAAGIAHEFRNSLSTIRGYLRLALRNPVPADTEARLAAAEAEAVQLGDAVTALLGFAGPMPVRSAEVDLKALLESALGRLRHQAENVELALECDETVVPGDPSLLSRAIENVIRNGIEAVQGTGRPGRVTVRCGGGVGATIVVEDEGAGVDAADVPSLFLPFRSRRPGGFGLGLALARKIVVLHGGTIGMEPRAEGGVRVRIDLPGSPVGSG